MAIARALPSDWAAVVEFPYGQVRICPWEDVPRTGLDVVAAQRIGCLTYDLSEYSLRRSGLLQ